MGATQSTSASRRTPHRMCSPIRRATNSACCRRGRCSRYHGHRPTTRPTTPKTTMATPNAGSDRPGCLETSQSGTGGIPPGEARTAADLRLCAPGTPLHSNEHSNRRSGSTERPGAGRTVCRWSAETVSAERYGRGPRTCARQLLDVRRLELGRHRLTRRSAGIIGMRYGRSAKASPPRRDRCVVLSRAGDRDVSRCRRVMDASPDGLPASVGDARQPAFEDGEVGHGVLLVRVRR